MYPLWNQDRVVYEWENDVLRIGSDDDDVQEISGNTQVWKEIIKMFDGKSTVDEVAKKIAQRCEITEEKAKSFISTFYKKRLIDIHPNKYDEENDFNIYFQSTLTYYASTGLGGYRLLEELQNTKVTILGCGAGGSHIAYYLSQLGLGHIHVVDPDVVSRSNINRQALFELSDIGKLKVDCLKNSIEKKNPYVKISTSTNRLVTPNDVMREIEGSNWVICSMDEPPYVAQRITSYACFEKKIPSMYCFSQKSAGKLFVVNPNVSGCADCLLLKNDSESFRNLVTNFLSMNEELVTANIKPNISMLCSWVAKKWFDCFVDPLAIHYNKLFRLDFNTFKEEVFEEFDKMESCPTCGDGLQKSDSPLWEIISIWS